jgi:hypothetical protein
MTYDLDPGQNVVWVFSTLPPPQGSYPHSKVIPRGLKGPECLWTQRASRRRQRAKTRRSRVCFRTRDAVRFRPQSSTHHTHSASPRVGVQHRLRGQEMERTVVAGSERFIMRIAALHGPLKMRERSEALLVDNSAICDQQKRIRSITSDICFTLVFVAGCISLFVRGRA